MKNLLIEDIDGLTWISFNGWSFSIPLKGRHRLKGKRESTASNGEIFSPMPGQVLKIFVTEGTHVKEGDSLCIIEAMKMEHSLKAPFSGFIKNLNFKPGDSLQSHDRIMFIEQEKGE